MTTVHTFLGKERPLYSLINPKQTGGGGAFGAPMYFFCPSTFIFDTLNLFYF